jgi:hypothetical protein
MNFVLDGIRALLDGDLDPGSRSESPEIQENDPILSAMMWSEASKRSGMK